MRRPGLTASSISIRILSAFVSLGFAAGLGPAVGIAAAQTATIRVEVFDASGPLAGAAVTAGSQPVTTDTSGLATLTVQPGQVLVIAMKDGYETRARRLDVTAGQEFVVRLGLVPTIPGEDQPAVVVSTRIPRRLESQSVPMELLERRTIREQTPVTPGNISFLLDGLRSVRMQTTSPELGMAMPRIRGLRGQYARLLSDGVALDHDHPGGLAPMQISPLDLGQVEVLPDGATPLFGANALSGAINMVSRKPGTVREREFLLSQSMQGTTDAGLWLSFPAKGSWSSTYLVGGHFQDERDVDDDGWSDIPDYRRGNVRTRVLWDNRQGKAASGTAGVTFEKRSGGSAIARQELETKEADGALFGRMPLGKYVLAGAGTLFVQSRVRDFNDVREHERRESATIEITLSSASPRHTWLAGITSDWFAIRSSQESEAEYVSTRPGIFFHDEFQVAPWLAVSGSARVDNHNLYKLEFSPRGSALVHKGAWAARLSAGRSYFAPFPPLSAEEIEAAGLTPLTIAEPIGRESAVSVSADLSHTTPSTGFKLAVFRTKISDPALVDRATYTLYTAADPIVTNGVELSGTVRRSIVELTATYVWIKARERGDIEVALTPEHSGSILAMAGGRRGRAGVQVLFTGEQRLDANPYRTVSESYTVTNLLSEFSLGRGWNLFANAENVTDVRQTRWDPLARPLPDVDGRWTVDAWAPLRGRMVNIGLRVSF